MSDKDPELPGEEAIRVEQNGTKILDHGRDTKDEGQGQENQENQQENGHANGQQNQQESQQENGQENGHANEANGSAHETSDGHTLESQTSQTPSQTETDQTENGLADRSTGPDDNETHEIPTDVPEVGVPSESVPEISVSDVPEISVSDVPSPRVSDVPASDVSDVPSPRVSVPRVSDVSRASDVPPDVSGPMASTSRVSHIFTSTLEKLLTHKSTKKNEDVKKSINKAIEQGTHEAIFEALTTTCTASTSSEVKSIAIDLFAKLFDHAQFDSEEDKVGMTEKAVDVIAGCFDGEGTDADLELQVVRALMHSILLMPCHGASLLKAVRQIYNVFIFSLSARNQAIAQGILTQVIGAVFSRVKGEKREGGEEENVYDYPLTLEKMDESYDERNDFEDADVAVKDAFLIFRAMCKLSVKPLEETLDMRSHAVRSKLLSLHIIHIMLKGHIETFLSDVVMNVAAGGESTRLICALRPYICLALSRNAASPVAPVFELSLEIFWVILSNLRQEFKREIAVFFDEIYLPVAEMKTSTPHQKRYLLSVIERLCNDSRCIIEFYLNYDCDSGSPNICEKVVDYLTRLSLVRVEVSAVQRTAYHDNKRVGISVYDVSKIANLTSSTMSSKAPEPEVYALFPLDYALKMTAIGCIVAFLRSLHSWAHKGMAVGRARSDTGGSSSSVVVSRTESFVDPPEQFESLKQRKKTKLEGVRQFNMKGRRGVAFFVENGFVEDDPASIARFLLATDGLDKQALGEYLGEADERNVATMHAFVDAMSFDDTEFVEAMRRFLQAFRLPGEAQKIDRFMLKFAERYVLGNPGVFSNADAAYILAYSVIMLNTDLHSPQVKKRMTVDSFVANNKGIDDGKDLPREMLVSVYEEIQRNEIKLQSEQHAALLGSDGGHGGSGFFARDMSREAYIHASKEMSVKAEKMMRGKRKEGVFYAASNIHHVKSIFDTLWMSVLAGLTPPFKEHDEEAATCLEGMKLSVRIACMFGLEYARTSFIGALVQFMKLSHFDEMRPKNVDAVYVMLSLVVSEGNGMGSSWGQVLTSISQLERLVLIAQGVDQDSIPDVGTAKVVRTSQESSSFFSHRTHHLSPAVAQLLTQTEMEVAVDRVFSSSAHLSGENILLFVQALAEVAYEEIESSGQSSNPRTFSLQKIVDICYYNMDRIRLEWSQLWAVMGDIFMKVGCHTNPAISFLALDSLRQLSMRFLEIDELAHFKFQKEFLQPFVHVVSHNDSLEVKDMVLECINNMVLARAGNIRSGWKAVFAVLTTAARGNKESMVSKAYKVAFAINKDYIDEVRAQDSFADLVVCFTELAKNERFQKVSLAALDVLQRLVTDVAKYHKDSLSKLWFPVLFAFYDILMTGEELEVRSRASSILFGTVLEWGAHFDRPFWDSLCDHLLFPIFGIVDSTWCLAMDTTNDKVSVWLSTTLIQALKSMVEVFSTFFTPLSHQLQRFLDLAVVCVCQENDTIASIGRSCLAAFLVDNAAKFSAEQWDQVVGAMVKLFDLTTAKELFEHDSSHSKDVEKSSIVLKSVLQLLLIQTVSELFENDAFYEAAPQSSLMKLADLLLKSYEFARAFNDDYDLRVRLWNAKVIERLPNLLKQESSSSAVLINIMFRMYCDDDKTDGPAKREIMDIVIPLCCNIVKRYGDFDETNQQRNIATWRPVVVEIFQGYVELDEEDFRRYGGEMYGLTMGLFRKGMSGELRGGVRMFLERIGTEFIHSSTNERAKRSELVSE